LYKNGNSIVCSLPKPELRRLGLLEDGEIVDDAHAVPHVDYQEGRIEIEIGTGAD
jgi:hypothetical protein